MGVPFWKIKFTFFIFIFITAKLSFSQNFDREWIAGKINATLKEKIKTSPQDILTMYLEGNYGNTDNPIRHNQHFIRNGINQNISGTGDAESEITAAINPLDSNNIVVAAMKSIPGALGSSLAFPVYYTKDFGTTWHLSSFADDTTFPDIPAGGGDPVLTFSPDGNLHLTWLIVSINLSLEIKFVIKYAISTDGGVTWEISTNPIGVGILSNNKVVDKEWLGADFSEMEYSGNLYCSYTSMNPLDTTVQILIKTKNAGAVDFNDVPVVLNPDNMDFAQFSSVDVDAEGKVHVIFAGIYNENPILGLFHTKSIDGGQTFSPLNKISNVHLPCFLDDDMGDDCVVIGIEKERLYPCNHLRIDKSGGDFTGNLYATWTSNGFTEQETEGLDIYFSKSEDGGESWSSPIVLNTDENENIHNFYSSIWVSPEGRVILAWYDRRIDNDNIFTAYYMTYSDDGGETFVSDFLVCGNPTDFSTVGNLNDSFGIGEYNQMVGTSSFAIPFWADGSGNDGNLEIFTSFIQLGNNGPVSTERITRINSNLILNNISPNPANSYISIDFVLKGGTDVNVEIINSKGSVVRKEEWTKLGANRYVKNINITGLPSGSYRLRLFNISDEVILSFIVVQ